MELKLETKLETKLGNCTPAHRRIESVQLASLVSNFLNWARLG